MSDDEEENEREDGGAEVRPVTNLKLKFPSGYFSWTLARKEKLAKIVKNVQAYIKTDTSFEIKFGIVKQRLMEEDDFQGMEIGWKALQTQFNRDTSLVLRECGIENDKINLSGMEKKPTEYQSLHISMAEEVQRKEKKRKLVATKEKEKEMILDGIAGEHLLKQGKKKTTDEAVMRLLNY